MNPSEPFSFSDPAGPSAPPGEDSRRATRTALGAMDRLLENTNDLVETTDPALFSDAGDPVFRSSPGGHIRHLLDHVQALLDGLHSSDGFVYYDRRARGTAVESDRDCCVGAIREIRAGLAEWRAALDALDTGDDDGSVATASFHPDRVVTVEQIVDPDSNAILLRSTALRELVFVFHHSIHHAATLAARMRSAGFAVPEQFGIAPATLAANP